MTAPLQQAPTAASRLGPKICPWSANRLMSVILHPPGDPDDA